MKCIYCNSEVELTSSDIIKYAITGATVIEIISLLHANKDKYDKTKSFNSNLPIILNLRGDTIGRTIEDKEKFIKTLVERDKSKTLSEYIWQGIFTFQEIYGYEMKLINQE